MASIFLSYAREDRSFAEVMAHVLEGAGPVAEASQATESRQQFTADGANLDQDG